MLRTCVLFLAVLAASPSEAAATDLLGHWEGELLGDRRPYRVEIFLSRSDGETHGRLLIDGRIELQVADLSLTRDQVRLRTNLNGRDLPIDLKLDDAALRGTVEVGDTRLELALLRLPEYEAPRDRAEAWRQDLELVRTRFLRFDRSFSPDSRASATSALTSLSDRADRLTDEQIIVGLSEAVASSGNAHTRVYLLRNRTNLRRMPVRVHWFDDGLFVVQATRRHEALLGCRVDRIEGTLVDDAQARVGRLFAGPPSWRRYKGPYFLTSPEILGGVGIASDMESIAYAFDCAGEERTVELQPLPLERKDTPTEAWRELSPRSVADDWRHVLTGDRLPLFLERPDQHYWMRELSDANAIYFQYNRSQDMPDGDGLAAFGERLLKRLREDEPSRLVVDLRFNTGGNTGVARSLFRELAAFPDPAAARHLYLLVGRATFSAGIYHAAQLALVPGVILVGEPVGDVLDTWSEGGNIVLPNSGITVHYTNGYHSYSTREIPEWRPYFSDLSLPDHALEPHVRVGTAWADYVAGVDPLLESVLPRASSR